MKKKETILISIIIILIISLIGTIIYFSKKENLTTYGEVLIVGSNYLLVGTTDGIDYLIKTDNKDYQEGDTLELILTNIKKDEIPYEAKAKKITLIKNNQNNNHQDIDNNDNNLENNFEENNNNTSNNETNNEQNDNQSNNNNSNEQSNTNNNQTITSSENGIISYFENLNNEVDTYSNNQNESLGKTIKSKFVECIDFIFYGTEIKGKTFEQLSNEAKIKIISITLSIDSKIDEYFPGYKDTINKSYQNIKSKLIEKYLEITTNICNNNQDLCQTAKENFSSLKENFGITWSFIKDLANNGWTKLKDWYEIWRYN